MLQHDCQLSLLPACDSHSPVRELRVIGLGMEAEPTGAQQAFFRRSSMSCPKCAGLLVAAPSPFHLLSDYFIDTYDLQDHRSGAVRCVNCGYYADQIVVQNKAKQADAQRLVAQAEGWALDHTAAMEGLYHAQTDLRRTLDAAHSVRTPQCAPQDGGATKQLPEPCRADVF